MGLTETNSGWCLGKILQPVHPVGHARLGILSASLGDIVPARPDLPSLRHQTGIAMQPHGVRGIVEAAEQIALARRSVVQQRQRLVGMAGEHDLVEAIPLTRGVAYVHALGIAANGTGRRGESRLATQGRHYALDIGTAAAAHGAPAKLRSHRQQAVVVQEAGEAYAPG